MIGYSPRRLIGSDGEKDTMMKLFNANAQDKRILRLKKKNLLRMR